MRRMMAFCMMLVILVSFAGFRYNDRERVFEVKEDTGSVKYLDGKTVLVSIFVDDLSASWNKRERRLVANNLKLAVDYLVEQGEKYNKKVELIYDTNDFPDLEYIFSYDEAFDKSWLADGEIVQKIKFHKSLDDYIKKYIDSAAILKKFNADSIGYIFFIDGETNRAITYPYYVDYNGEYYAETSIIPIRWDKATNVEPATYAHEIIHMFGVPDLYMTSKEDGVTKDFVKYVNDAYENDIMLGDFTDYKNNLKITAQITDVTAYFLGWKDSFAGLERFSSVTKEKPSVNKIKKVAGDYGDYNSNRRFRRHTMTSDEIRNNTIKIVGGIVLMVLGFILCTKKRNY